MKKPRKVKNIKKDADTWFSRYMRLKHSVDEICTCYTCSYTAHWKKFQNGHMVSRYYLATRYDEDNCRPQCYTCNMFRNGMIPTFSARLEKELGEGITKKLYKKAMEIVPDFDYQKILDEYKEKFKSLENKESVL